MVVVGLPHAQQTDKCCFDFFFCLFLFLLGTTTQHFSIHCGLKSSSQPSLSSLRRRSPHTSPRGFVLQCTCPPAYMLFWGAKHAASLRVWNNCSKSMNNIDDDDDDDDATTTKAAAAAAATTTTTRRRRRRHNDDDNRSFVHQKLSTTHFQNQSLTSPIHHSF